MTYLGIGKDGLLERQGVGYTISRAQMTSLEQTYQPEAAVSQLDFLSGQSKWWATINPRTRSSAPTCMRIDSRVELSLLAKVAPEYRQTWCQYVGYIGLHSQLVKTAIQKYYPIVRFNLLADQRSLNMVDKADPRILTYPAVKELTTDAPGPYLVTLELWSGVPAREDRYRVTASIVANLFHASDWISAVQVKVVTQAQPASSRVLVADTISEETFTFHKSQLSALDLSDDIETLRQLSESARAIINKERL